MFGAFSQAARLGIGAVAAVAVAAGAWLYARPPGLPPGPPPSPAPLAAAAPPAAPAPAVAPVAAPAAAPEKTAERFAPTLDVVRVDAAGNATVAGQSEASAQVSLRVDDAQIAVASSDSAGAFASLFTLPPSDAPRILTVVATGADGVAVAGKDRVILAPFIAPEKPPETVTAAADPAPEPAAPAALKQTETGVAVITAADIANVTIDSVTYDGEVIRIGGRGAGGAIVRLYLNNVDSASAPIGADGAFGADLLGVAAGTYTLRADQLDSAGKVTSRYEIDITKAAPQELATAAPAPAVIEVAAGTTLWAIAKAKFGDGLMYVQVYEANKDKIRDPNLIYPGQVLSMPTAP